MAYYSNDNLFIIDRDMGLYILTSQGPDQINADPRFYNDNEIAFIVSTGLNGYLLGTTNNGMYQLNGAGLTPWEVNINQRFKKEQIYTGLKLNNEQIAIGTTQNGVYIIDGRMVKSGMIRPDSYITCRGIKSRWVYINHQRR